MVPDTQNDRFEWLEKRVAQLELENLKLKKQVLKLQKENLQLKRRLLAYENAHTPPSKTRKKREPKEPSGKIGAPLGHEKHERKEPEPTQTVEHKAELCSRCGSKLGKSLLVERRAIEEIPNPKPIQVTEHLIHHYKCKKCGKQNVAPHKLPKGSFGFNLQTHVTLLRFEDRLPLRKVVNSLQRHYRIKLSNVAVLNITKRAARTLRAEYQKLLRLLRASKVVYADETEIKVNGKTYWIWVFVGEHGTVYAIKPTRSKKVVVEILGERFTGVVTSDGFNAYSSYKIHQRCWAHIMREAKALLEQYPRFGLFYKKLKRMYSQLQRAREKPPPLPKREALKKRLENRMQLLVDVLESYRKFKQFTIKLRNGIGCWFTCLIHTFVEPTNNNAERALRELIVQRKIIGGLRAEHGAQTMATINTMLATWRAKGQPLFPTLKNALIR